MEFGKITLHARRGRKYVRAIFLFWAVTTITSSAQTFTTLVNFSGAPSAHEPWTLIQGAAGNFYGETRLGVASGQCQSHYCGTIFRMTPQGEVTTLYGFCTQANCPDGQLPSSLLQATDGNFYGTTIVGGSGNAGTLFRITPAGEFTTLHSFCAQRSCADGANPVGLMQAADGDLYGTVFSAGSGYGTVFKVTTAGKFATFYTFTSGTGSFPTAGLIQGRDGNFYGTTSSTGGLACFEEFSSCGTAFRLTRGGTLTVIHTFCASDCSDGAQPGQLIQGADGSLYGTTSAGGYSNPQNKCGFYGCGTLFKITPSGKFSTLYTFCSPSDIDCANGLYPSALVQGSDGNIYGTASQGGDVSNRHCENGCGTTFEITPSGTLTTLHTFEFSDGEEPGPLLQATNGSFYGATLGGGSNFFGTIYNLSTGLGPFVETNPGAGKAGANIAINGSDLTGTTAVTFNVTPAQFEVVAKTVVIAKVPTAPPVDPLK